jgi:rhodanese-related sulfurtransferase
MNPDLEIDLEKARALARAGKSVFVIAKDSGELELVKKVLGAGDVVYGVDFGEARRIIFKEGDRKSLEECGLMFRDAVIVCPHGRTSLRLAGALSEMGIRAYSLKGGIEELKGGA